jgi:hypothetical protein
MRYLLFIGFICILTSCCKQLCEDEHLVVQLKGFTPSAIDTLVVTRYPVGDGFVHPIDSSFEYPLSNGADSSAVLISLTRAVNVASEFKVNLSGLSTTWLLTNIQTGARKCSCGNGHYKAIVSCAINGVEQKSPSFLIEP